MDERERSPRQVVLNKAYFHRLSIAQLLKLMNIILEELLQRLHVSVSMVDPLEVRTSAPDPDPENPTSGSSSSFIFPPAPAPGTPQP